jgi:hypothetical protein
MVPADSRRVSRAPRYSGTRVRVRSAFTYVAITLCGRLFQVVRLAAGLVTLGFYTDARPPTPSPPRSSGKWQVISDEKLLESFHLFSPLVTCHTPLLFGRLGLGSIRVRSPLLAESRLFSFPPGTEMVHFPGLARTRLWIQRAVPDVFIERVSPFGNPRVKGCFPLTGAYRR